MKSATEKSQHAMHGRFVQNNLKVQVQIILTVEEYFEAAGLQCMFCPSM